MGGKHIKAQCFGPQKLWEFVWFGGFKKCQRSRDLLSPYPLISSHVNVCVSCDSSVRLFECGIMI